MNILEAINNSVRVLSRNKMRSFLTMLGIIIGVMAVIVVMSIGESVQDLILNEVKSMGSNLVGVLPGKVEGENQAPASLYGITITTLKYEDGEKILESNLSYIIDVSMYARGNSIAIWENEQENVSFVGTNSGYINVENAFIEKGRFYTNEEDESFSKVAVLGSNLAKNLFGNSDPLGEKIKIEGKSFTVIGVFKERGGGLSQDQDNEVYIPLKTAQKLLLGIDYISMMRIKVDDSENIDKSVDYVESILRESHGIDDPSEDDFVVRSTKEALSALSTVTDALKFFLVLISAISLIVGGFGIMNIMMATVEERTKEIGLRRAVGAKNYHIVLQFLIESIVITFISGLIGILIGLFILFMASKIINFLGFEWNMIISVSSISVACLVSIIVGLIFGIIPAQKASKLNPIEALRYE